MNLDNELKQLRPIITIGEIIELLKKHKILSPIPTRATFVHMCEDGRLETAPRLQSAPNATLYVYQDSFLAWVKAVTGG